MAEKLNAKTSLLMTLSGLTPKTWFPRSHPEMELGLLYSVEKKAENQFVAFCFIWYHSKNFNSSPIYSDNWRDSRLSFQYCR
jgi:hypothetical protein